MITATGLELRAGSRILLADATLRVQPGDRIGLVGRNGAGKTTTLRVLAGEGAAVRRARSTGRGAVGYLPQDPRTGDLDVTAQDRVLSARGLDALLRRDGEGQIEMAELADDAERTRLVRRYGALEDRFAALGGYAAEAEAARICANLGLPDRVLAQTDRHAVRRPAPPRRAGPDPVRATPARPAAARCCSTSRPTTSTPTRSSGCATSCAAHNGGLVVISHDVDAARRRGQQGLVPRRQPRRASTSTTWAGRRYLEQRETDEQRRRRERANAEKKAGALMAQADKMRAKATKAVAAQNMARRAEQLLAGLDERAGRATRWPRSASRPRRRAARPR